VKTLKEANKRNRTVTVTGQYVASNYTFTGTKKQVINYLRDEARRMRRESRTSRHLEDSVHAIDDDLHPSKLITMASFKLNNLGIDCLLDLINNHGVIKYTVAVA
jgi:hypothetical protein